jgi:hypothetical protein
MSKVTRDGIIREAGAGDDQNHTTHVAGDRAPAGDPNTPPPRKRLDLNATITLSEDALAELLAEVKNGRGASDRDGEIPPANLDLSPERPLDRPPERRLPERAPAQSLVPHLWRRAEGASKQKV